MDIPKGKKLVTFKNKSGEEKYSTLMPKKKPRKETGAKFIKDKEGTWIKPLVGRKAARESKKHAQKERESLAKKGFRKPEQKVGSKMIKKVIKKFGPSQKATGY